MSRPRAWDAEDVEFLLSFKESPQAIAARFAITTGAIARTLHREDRHDLARPFDRVTMAARRAARRAAA